MLWVPVTSGKQIENSFKLTAKNWGFWPGFLGKLGMALFSMVRIHAQLISLPLKLIPKLWGDRPRKMTT